MHLNYIFPTFKQPIVENNMPHSLISFFFLCNALFQASYTKKTSIVSFDQGFNPLYGEHNVVPYEGNKSVRISMDERSSSGFHSKLMYVNGFFQSSFKLPNNYSAGVVVTFYMSNQQKYPYRHDEIDFEFLGHIHGEKWVLQTNFYGNGSVHRGREERYKLWFDPSEDFHLYGILWTDDRIGFHVDGVPIRHVKKVETMASDFPSKEMRLYGTIWNGSDWATHGGKYKLDMTYGPYVAKFTNFDVSACALDSVNTTGQCLVEQPNDLSHVEEKNMQKFRKTYMTYSYCYDTKRYAVPFPECVPNLEELAYLQKIDPHRFGTGRG